MFRHALLLSLIVPALASAGDYCENDIFSIDARFDDGRGEIDGRSHLVAELEVDLAVVWRGERVWLPELHGAILPDRDVKMHVHARDVRPRGVETRS